MLSNYFKFFIEIWRGPLEEGARAGREAQKMAEAYKEALCWQCRRATGGCEWSAHLQPVPGWRAERTFHRVRCGGTVRLAAGLRVAACPKFERDRRERHKEGR